MRWVKRTYAYSAFGMVVAVGCAVSCLVDIGDVEPARSASGGQGATSTGGTGGVGVGGVGGASGAGANASGGTAGASGAGGTAGSGGVAGSGGATSKGYCPSLSPAPAFCADFDAVTSAEQGWTRFAPGQSAAHQELDFAKFVSPSASAHVWLDSSADCGSAQLQQVISPEIQRFHFEFDVFIEADGGYFFVLRRQLSGADCLLLLQGPPSAVLTLQTTKLSSPDDNVDIQFNGAGNALGKWSHVVLDVALDSSSPTLALKWDGASLAPNMAIASSAWAGACTGSADPASTEVWLGPHCRGGSAGPETSFRFDNVVVSQLK